jgi:Strabismus protein
VKLVLLALGTWAVFWRPTRATMPRIFFLRSLVLLLVFVTTFAYCLFYGVRVVEQQDQLDYKVSHAPVDHAHFPYFAFYGPKNSCLIW